MLHFSYDPRKIVTKGHNQMGLYLEELAPGLRIECEIERRVDASMIEAFATLAGDHNPLHFDDETARRAGFPGRIAHGVLGLAIATGLLAASGVTAGTLIALVGVEWSFRAPVHIGDTLGLAIEVRSTRRLEGRGRGLVVFALSVRNQSGEEVQRGTVTELVMARSEPPEPLAAAHVAATNASADGERIR
jgi:acyl dehydratase